MNFYDICKGSILRFVGVNKNETKDNKAVNVFAKFLYFCNNLHRIYR